MNLEEWRAAVSKSFAPLHIFADHPDEFQAKITEVQLDNVHLYDMETSAHQVLRDSSLIDDTQEPFCKMSLQLRGECQLIQDGRSCTLVPGDLGIYVTQRPYELIYPSEQASLVIIFPLRMMQMSPDHINLITATPVSRNSGLGRVAVPLFEQLAQNMQMLSGPHALALVKSALDILVTVLSAETRETAGGTGGTIIFHRAVSYIDAHLDDENLNPTTVAQALFISLRQLHTRFSERQLTVSSYIRRRRLNAIREDLSNPLLGHEPIHTISARYGLHDSAYVSKAFKQEFGESPAAFRKRILDGK